jgi:hypothetical protein
MIYHPDNTHRSELHEATEYLYHEESIRAEIIEICQSQGFHPIDPNTPDTVNQILTNGSRRIYISLVDDIRGLDLEKFVDLNYDDLVITDNFFYRPVRARVLYLPMSWYGMYHYVPDTTLDPDRILTLALNRANPERVHIFLDTVQMLKHPSMFVDEDMSQAYLSFNCVPKNVSLPDECSAEDKLREWHYQYSQIWFEELDYIKPFYTSLTESNKIPFRNYDITFDQAQKRGLLNMVVETYAFDEAVSFSEKTFRALVTPRPWALFGSRYLIGHLKNIGFDIMDDILDHRHDELPLSQFKLKEYVRNSIHQAHYLKWEFVSDRCHQAAQYNQNLLLAWKQQWPEEFSLWKSTLQKLL